MSSEADTVRHGSVDDSENWVQAEDPATGRAYWINQRTRRRRGRPRVDVLGGRGRGRGGAEAFDANSQRNYYINKRTKRSTWSRPMLGQLRRWSASSTTSTRRATAGPLHRVEDTSGLIRVLQAARQVQVRHGL